MFTSENIKIVSFETLSFPKISIFFTISLLTDIKDKEIAKMIDDNNLIGLMNI